MRPWHSVICAVWASSAFSSPLTASNPSLLSLPIPDVTTPISNLSVGPIPSDFKLQLQMGPIPLQVPELDYYYSFAFALEEVALDDFNGIMREHTWNNPRVPQAEIMMNTRHGTIPRKYVVWGLTIAIGLMADHVGFGLTFFSLQWRGEEVGGLAIGHPRIANIPELMAGMSISQAKNTPSLSLMMDSLRNSTTMQGSQNGVTMAQPNPLSTDRVTIKVHRQPGPLRMSDTFLGLINALMFAAAKDKDERITQAWTMSLPDCHAEVITGEVVARTTAPFYTVRSLIKSLGLVASYFVNKGEYFELNFATKVNNVLVSASTLRHKRGPHLGNSMATS